MLAELDALFETLETGRRTLLKEIEPCTADQLAWRPGPDRWSILMTLEHIVRGEMLVRQAGSHDRRQRQPRADGFADMFPLVMEVLAQDLAVDVPVPDMEPDGDFLLEDLLTLWGTERKALQKRLAAVSESNSGQTISSHPVAGPLDAVRTLELAVAHFESHHRQIRRIQAELSR